MTMTTYSMERKERGRFGKVYSRKRKRGENKNNRCVFSIVVKHSLVGDHSHFLFTAFNYITKWKFTLQELARFLTIQPFRSTYASQGIYLLQGPPTQNVGVCRFFGITQSMPLFCMDFSAAPRCFMYMHSAMLLRSMFNSLFLLHSETIVSETIEVNDGQQKMIVVANGDEFSGAMTRKVGNYDMDPEDEKWLRKFNNKSLRVSNENFELIVDALEKAFHFNPDGCVDAKSAANQCPQDLGTKDVLKALSRYWIKKRKRNLTPPIRVFQNSEPERAPPIHQHLLRKRRSPRRRIRYDGGKYRGAWLEIAHEQNVLREIQKAEAAVASANALTKRATEKRTRAQLLMQRANMARYKANALSRIAEAAQAKQEEN